jgi:hypothetical protein
MLGADYYIGSIGVHAHHTCFLLTKTESANRLRADF